MINIERHILLSSGSGLGIGTISTTSSTPGETTNPTYAYIDTTQFNGATYYFECLFKTSAGTATAALYDTSGNLVASSAVTTTSGSPTIVRSAAISPSTGTYTVRLSVTGGNTLTYYSSRVIVVQNASAITATEEQRDLISDSQAITSASYADFSTIFWDYFRYTSANWDNATFYLDVTFKNSSGTGTVGLHTAAGVLVTNAECATTSATYVRVGSPSFTLVDGTDYYVRGKSSTGTVTIASAKLVIQQALPTKSESYLTLLRSTTAASATSGTFQDSLYKITYTSGNWSTDTISWFHEVGANSNTASGTLELYNLTGAARTTGSNIATINAGMTRYRSGAVTMPTSQDITERCDSAAGTVYTSLSHLIAVMTWTNATTTSTSTTTSTTTTSTSTSTTTTSTSSSTSTTTTSTSTTVSGTTTSTSTSTTTTSTSTSTTTSTSTSITTTSTTVTFPYSIEVEPADQSRILSFQVDRKSGQL